MVALILLIQLFVPNDAQAYYLNFQTNKIFSPYPNNATAGGTLANGFISIAQNVTTGILLPIGILMTTWRTIYLAIFPLMMKIDPLDLMRNGRYTRDKQVTGTALNDSTNIVEHMFGGSYHSAKNFQNDRAGTKNSKSNYAGSALDASFFEGAYTDNGSSIGEYAQKCIKIELKHMVVALLVVFAVWGVIQIILQLSIVFLDIAEQTAGSL